MRNDSSVLCIIPARGGSKGIPRKNLRTIAGKPLIAYSIEHALESQLIHRTIVSTDDVEIAEVARGLGAEVPFMRPSEIAGDTSTDLEVFQHALKWLTDQERYEPEMCVHLRPTCPVRRVEDIDNIISILKKNPNLDSVRSLALAPETPFKMWFRDSTGLLSGVVNSEIKDPHNLPRQSLPTVYLQNAAIDAVRTRVITEQASMTGQRIFGYVMDTFCDIDSESDLAFADKYLSAKSNN